MTQATRGVRRIVQWVGRGLAALCVAVAAYAAVAFYLYNRVEPGTHACRDCATPVSVGGYQLFYREVGTDRGGPPIIVVHGGPGHSSLSFKSGLDFLGERTRVAFYDQRGSGNSQSKAHPADYHIDSLVAELEAIRRDVLHADSIVLVGHSFGSAVVQRYAIAHGEHVAKLVIVGGIRLNNGMTNRAVWRWLGPALYSTVLGFPPGDVDAADRWFTDGPDSDNVERLHDPANRTLLAGMGISSFAAWREISLSLVGDDLHASLARVRAPTLFIYGESDSEFTGKPTATYVCSVIPDCTAVGFTRSGHWPYLEEPERFREVVSAFLFAPQAGSGL